MIRSTTAEDLPHKSHNSLVYYLRMKIPVQFILDQIPRIRYKPTVRKEILGITVKVSGRRIQTFKQCGTTCASCGVEATHWEFVETREGWKLVLMADEVEMTQDHIYPKSRGGHDELWNAQTMCLVCNMAKSNIVEDSDALARELEIRKLEWESEWLSPKGTHTSKRYVRKL